MEIKNASVVNFLDKVESPILKPANVEQQLEEMKTETFTQHSEEMLYEKIEEFNEILEPTSTSLKFQLHEKLDEYYVQVIDTETNAIIKEIPNKKFLDMYASMVEMAGLLVDEKL